MSSPLTLYDVVCLNLLKVDMVIEEVAEIAGAVCPVLRAPFRALPSAFRRLPRLATRPFSGAASHGRSALEAALTAAG